MKKMLAVVRRTEDGFRGYVPKLPGCEIHAATPEQAEADITAAAKAHLAAGKEGTNGVTPDQVEIVVMIEAPPPARPRPDGMDELYDQAWREFDPAELEQLLDIEERIKAGEGGTFEELMSELGFEVEEPTGESAE
jgi:predicted RNase H-like HicB family nuclease